MEAGSMEWFLWFCSEPQLVSSFCSSERRGGSTWKENNISEFHILLERSPWWIEFTWSTGVRVWKYLRICCIQILIRWRLRNVCPLDVPPPAKPIGNTHTHTLLAQLSHWTTVQTMDFLGAWMSLVIASWALLTIPAFALLVQLTTTSYLGYCNSLLF